jgi:predicted unusual protein kinase regulating ubiquinone biosynthesis (AarF/ABC1/UbiB family)
MPISTLLKPSVIKRYKDIARLFIKYGRSDFLKNSEFEDFFDDSDDPSHKEIAAPEELAKDLEKMGPTFIKLGQVLSTHADLFPQSYLEALSRLQDNVEPFSFAEVEEIISSELGFKISKGFEYLEAEPLAAASLGQVHRGVTIAGTPVAVKVQRPGIRKLIAEDLEALYEIANLLQSKTEFGRHYEPVKILDQFRKSLMRELDYKQEARNLEILKNNLQNFSRIFVPSPIHDYTSSIILTMDYVQGKKITSIGPLTRVELDATQLVDDLFRAYLHQILVDGFFHADPHPGNVFLTDDFRIALIDVGMVAQFSPRLQENLLGLLVAVSDGKSEEAVSIALRISEKTEKYDAQEFQRKLNDLIGENQTVRPEELQVGRLVMDIARISSSCGVKIPPEVTMLGKTLLNLDIVGRSLDPYFDPNEAIRRHSSEILRHRMAKSLTPSNVLGTFIETKEFLERLPHRLNKIMDGFAENNIKVTVDAFDEAKLMAGFQKVANRITVGLILAALIIGAAMLMRIESSFKILGYPGIAMVFFLAAAIGGIALVINILFSDEQPSKK